MLPEPVGLLELILEAVKEPDPVWPLKDASGDLLTVSRALPVPTDVPLPLPAAVPLPTLSEGLMLPEEVAEELNSPLKVPWELGVA